jgi:hypothetical protein
MAAECEAHEGLIALLDPFVADTDDRIGALVVLENADEFAEASAVAGGHAIDFVENNTESTVPLGAEEVGYIIGM